MHYLLHVQNKIRGPVLVAPDLMARLPLFDPMLSPIHPDAGAACRLGLVQLVDLRHRQLPTRLATAFNVE